MGGDNFQENLPEKAPIISVFAILIVPKVKRFSDKLLMRPADLQLSYF